MNSTAASSPNIVTCPSLGLITERREFWARSYRLAFKRSEDGGEIVACDPKEAQSAEQAIRMANSLTTKEGHCGAIAFSRTGDPALGEFEDAVVLKTLGEVDAGLLST